jgi:hypothetical protein
MAFFPRLQIKSLSLLEIEILAILDAHNVLYKALIKVKSKVVAFIKSFPMICNMPPTQM